MAANSTLRLAGGVLAFSVLAAGEGSASESSAGPVVLSAGYTGEAWSTLRGGARAGSAYLEKIDAALELDGAAWGWSGTTVLVSALYTNGDSISGDHVGDLQGISNIEGDGALRPYEAWLRREWASAAVKLGVIDLNTEFDANGAGGLFVNSSHGIAPEFSQAGANGPSIFPVTGLGAVAEAWTASGWSVKIGAFDGRPGRPDRPRRLDYRLGDGDGALFAVEGGWRPTERARISVGAWRHTDWAAEIDETPIADRASGAYALLESAIWEDGDGGLEGFLRLGAAEGGELGRYLGGGLVYEGRVAGIGSERLGLAFGLARLDGDYRRRLTDAGSRSTRGELHAELTYRVEFGSGLALQPTLQYVANPGADPDVEDAWVVGLRLQFGRSWPLAAPRR